MLEMYPLTEVDLFRPTKCESGTIMIAFTLQRKHMRRAIWRESDTRKLRIMGNTFSLAANSELASNSQDPWNGRNSGGLSNVTEDWNKESWFLYLLQKASIWEYIIIGAKLVMCNVLSYPNALNNLILQTALWWGYTIFLSRMRKPSRTWQNKDRMSKWKI